MAKQSKKPAAKAAKSAKKPGAKKPAAKTPVAKKPGPKATGKAKSAGAAGKKPQAAKAVTKAPPTQPKSKATKKPAGKGAKKPVKGTTPVASLGENAPLAIPPQITSPTNGATVAANADLTVTISTTHTADDHVLELVNTATGVVTYSATIPAPGTSPFSHTVPAAKMTASTGFQLRARAVGIPGMGKVNITTGP